MSLLNSQSRGPINRADRLTHGSPYICLTADSRSSKHCKLCRFEIKSTQPRSQMYVPINCYSLSVNKFVKKKKQETPAERGRNACREGSLLLARGKTWRSMQQIFYKSKTSPRFPNFEASNAWQMGHNSREGFFFFGQELLLDFAAWIDLTSNADNTITVYQLPSKFQNTF